MMHHIRPWKFFSLVPERTAWGRMVQVRLPLRKDPEYEDMSLLLLETFVLLALCRAAGVRTVFEFGTYLGSTTLNLAANLPANARIWTFDLDEETGRQQTGVWETLVRLRERFPLEFAGTPVERKIVALTGDSRRYDFSRFRGQADLVFCDGDRTYPEARSDTDWAFEMVAGRPSPVIAWHDYQNPNAPDHTRFLDEMAETMVLYHPEDTKLCIYLGDPALRDQLK